MNLKDFEQYIDPKILERGRRYYEQGNVSPDSPLTHNGKSLFTVFGTEPYDVTITLEDDEVTDYSCTCPYDMEPVCKHVVAAMYLLAEGEYTDFEEEPVTPKKQKTKKHFTKKDVEKFLDELSHGELKEFVRKACASDKRLMQDFVSSHINRLMPVSAETYRLQLEELVELCSGKYGFVDWESASDLGSGIESMVDAARKAIGYEDWGEAFYRLQAVVEEADGVLNNCDDSNGYVGGGIENAMECFAELCEKAVPEPLRTTIFNYSLDCFCKAVLKGWDWYWTFTECAVALAKDESEYKRIGQALDKFQKSEDSYRNYEYNHARDIRLELLKKCKTEKDVDDYLVANLDNPSFRRILIDRSMMAENYSEVLRLTEDGIRNDEKERPGTADDWRDLQLQMFIKTNDSEHIAELARYFFVQSNCGNNPRKYYYDLLKRNVPAAEWEKTKSDLIEEVTHKKHYPDNDLALNIYEWEDDRRGYFGHLNTCATLRRMEHAESLLTAEYKDDFIALYAKTLQDFVKDNMGRDAYQEACRYLRRMKKLSAKDAVENLIAGFRLQYKKRRALMEELSRV